MTIGELNRCIASKQRVLETKQKERATYDYILADLIGRSMARNYDSKIKLPRIHEVYPSLFDAEEFEEKEQEQLDELSIARFKTFANAFNKNFKESEVEVENE